MVYKRQAHNIHCFGQRSLPPPLLLLLLVSAWQCRLLPFSLRLSSVAVVGCLLQQHCALWKHLQHCQWRALLLQVLGCLQPGLAASATAQQQHTQAQ